VLTNVVTKIKTKTRNTV